MTERRFSAIKKVFETYDKSGDGFLDIFELETVLKTLGTFNNHEVGAVCTALDTNKDGEISYDEFCDWVRAPTDNKALQKAKAILAPKPDDGLLVLFYNYCGAGHSQMDGTAFSKICKDSGLLDKNLTETTVGLIFSNNKVKPKGQRRIDFEQFEIALEMVAERKGVPTDKVRETVTQATRPVLIGTKAEAVRFATDDRVLSRDDSEMSVSSKGKPPRVQRLHDPSIKTAQAAVAAAASAAAGYQADNTQLWKTFGIDSPAGRILKRLYSIPYDASKPQESPKKGLRIKTTWPPEPDTYVVVNGMRALTEGLHFRRSKNIRDLCHGHNDYVPWGASVQGERVDAAWLKVGERERFLPVEVNGTRLLKRWDGTGPHPKAPQGSLVKATSLPDLRLPCKPAVRARVLVGLPASGPLGGKG
mmetsp:Transcript_100086/g.298701  ORF Transcript_100086/g.298701 Transcript_100086/m.298701 type:complete len:418 (-) Transcript_100086:125-1378(-)